MNRNTRDAQNGKATKRVPTPFVIPRSRASPIIVADSDGGTPPLSQEQITATPAMNTPPASEMGRELVKIPTNVQVVEANVIDEFKPYQ